MEAPAVSGSQTYAEFCIAKTSRPSIRAQQQKRCYICTSPDHMANKYNARKEPERKRAKEETRILKRGSLLQKELYGTVKNLPSRKVFQPMYQTLLDWLYSYDSQERYVCTVQVSDAGCKPHCA